MKRRASRHEVRGGRLSDLSHAEVELYEAFVELVLDVTESGPTRPVLLVFDTFEEVIYRASEDLIGFWQMLNHLQSHPLARIRVLIASRVLPDTFDTPDVDRLALGELRPADAVDLLVRLGIDPGLAGRLAEQVGMRPLALRLAAEVALQDGLGPDGLSGLGAAGWASVGGELVRGLLYSRLLNHIHDPQVRKLAHPGMVLRRACVWVPRTLSCHATCTYSCTRPPSRSRRSGRTAALDGGGVAHVGGC